MVEGLTHHDVGGGILIPEEMDAAFAAKHMAAYAFARRFAARARVLEVGFGDGYGANYLAEVAADVTGVDVVPGHIPRAQQRYPRPNLHFLQTDGITLPFPDQTFDLVGAFQVIEHVPEPRLPEFLAHIRRVLRPTGVLCLSTLNLDHNRKPGHPYEKMRLHEKEFTAPELQTLLQRTFPQVTLYGLHLSPRHRFFQRLKKWGVNRWGPADWNPVARYFARDVSADDFVATSDVSQAALDLLAVCRPTRSPG
jgi:SAM-dependent methyltransferase